MNHSTTYPDALQTPRSGQSPAWPIAYAHGPQTVPANRIEDRQFLSMTQAYGRAGGLASGDAVARLLRKCSDQPISMLARWIVERSIVSIEWQSQLLIPLFQFDPSDMSLRPCVTQVVQELRSVFDAWELALWFAQPNVWLRDAAPMDDVQRDTAMVLEAARTDRFIAGGWCWLPGRDPELNLHLEAPSP
jgi:acyl-CoA synthetase (AMP-forming)/AMP-acid ligase II